jgi:uncharacterized membrane protein
MLRTKQSLSEERLQEIIGGLLRGGVLLAAGVTLIGGILYLLRYANTFPDYHIFRGEPADLRNMPGIMQDLIALKSRGIIQTGLMLLIATPVARVAFSLIAFAIKQDYLYVVVTFIVFTLLIYSIIGGGL